MIKGAYFHKRFLLIILATVTVFICFYLFLRLIKINDDSYSYPGYNLILISIDTLRADHLGCYGYNRNTSPNIDKLAESSIIFDNAFSNISLTVPSHITMFSSLYTSVHDIAPPDLVNRVDRLSESIITLPQILKNSGYETGAFMAIDKNHGFDKGFDVCQELDLLKWEEILQIDGYVTEKDFFTKSSIFEWIEEKKEKKFFLFFHTYSVHSPYISPDYNLFTNHEYEGSIPSTYEDYIQYSQAYDIKHNRYFDIVNKSDKNDIQHLVDLYDGCISYTDRNLGLLYKRLEELDLLDKTIIIITSDHGEEFCDHGNLGHGNLWVEHLHIPLIIKLPDGIKKRIFCDVGVIDIMPTVLDLLDINFKPKEYFFQGVSLIPAINESSFSRGIYAEEYVGEKISILSFKNKEWKVITPINKDKVDCNLFQITCDPSEQYDVSFNYPKIVKAMKRRIESIYSKNKKLKNKFVDKQLKMPISKETARRLEALGYMN